jgi:DNA polymerase III gamma/tau subunit
MPLQHIYRPQSFDEFVGNQETVIALKILLERKKDIPHCYLFTGPSGIGKTSIARIMRRELGCEGVAYHELDAADDRGIDAMRDLKDRSRYSPLMGPCSVYLIDECHAITGAATEALLKTLEEPPDHAFFFLCTTEADCFTSTMKRRLHCFDLKPVPYRFIQKYLESIYQKEGIDPNDNDKKIIEKICEIADGSPGIALKLLDQVIDLSNLEQAMGILEGGVGFSETKVAEIGQLLIKGEADCWNELNKKMKGITNPEKFRQKLMSYLAACLRRSGSDRIAQIMTVLTDPITINNGKAGLDLLLFTASKV